MSASAPAGRRSTSGSRRFDYCRFIELDYVPMETGYMVSMRPTRGHASSKSPTRGHASSKSPDRHGRAATSPATPRSRRTPAAASGGDLHGNASISSSNSGSCKGSDCSPTKGRQKYTACTNNHGIRPPPPEQYLTPLQQKEVCIRHLRARLKETISTLQDRDSEIDELRGRLYRMQEDWVEEECHRVEAQLALKEARQEIQQLKQAVDTVRARLGEAGGLSGDPGVQQYFQDINAQNHKLENLLLNMELAQAGLAKEKEAPGRRAGAGGSAPASVSGESPGAAPRLPGGGRESCSCDGSPARSLTRSSTYTRLSEQAERHGGLSGDGTQDSGFVCCGDGGAAGRADLLLEAAFLSEETASLLSSYTQAFSQPLAPPTASLLPHAFSHTLPRSFPHVARPAPYAVPHSSTYEKLCAGERLPPFPCGGHPCLTHHHLYLHPLREAGIQTESCPAPGAADLDTIAEQRTFRSQGCSPSSAEEDLDSIATSTSVTTATEPIPASKAPLAPPPPRSATVAFSTETPPCEGSGGGGEEEKQEREQREKTGAEEQTDPGPNKGERQQEEVEEERGGVAPTAAEEQQEAPFSGCCGDSWQLEAPPDNPRSGPGPGGAGPAPSEEPPHTSQPRRCASHQEMASVAVVEVQDEDGAKGGGAAGSGAAEAGGPGGSGNVEKSYWSRHFLVDLLAVAVPVVPTVAWLCRGPVRNGHPMYHIGSLLRGCCTVALHSLRRGGGLRHYPAGGGDLGPSQI